MKEIISALVEFQREVPEIPKDSTVSVETKTGGKYKFQYSSLPIIIKVIKPYLTKNGLSFFHQTGINGVMCTIAHTSGDTIQSEPLPITYDGTMQEIGSRITYARRYTLTSLLGISSEEDDDGNVSSGNKFDKNEIKEWLTEDQFKKAINSGEAGIKATLNAYNGLNGKGMKKEYKEKLKAKLQ